MPVLKARIGNAWVDVGGSAGSEVEIGPSDPIGTNAAAELWYDTDAVALMNDDMRWYSAWGQITAVGFSTQTTAGVNGVHADTGIAVTWNAVAGRRYKISVICTRVAATGASLDVLWTNAANVTQDFLTIGSQVAQGQQQIEGFTLYSALSSGSVTYKLRAASSDASAPVFQWATYPSTIVVEDVGPVGGTNVVPQEADLRWFSAWGIIAKGSFVGTSVSLPQAGNGTVVTNPLSVPTIVGRRYRVYFVSRAIGTATSSAPGYVKIDLRIGGGIIAANAPLAYQPPTTVYDTVGYEWLIDGDGTTKVFDVVLTSSWAATAYFDVGLGSFYVEDVGPVTGSAIIPQVAVTPWTNVTFLNGWSNFGGQYQTCQYRKVGDEVKVRGLCKGTLGAPPIFNLPVGFRPPASLQWATQSGGAFGWMSVDGGGDFRGEGAGASSAFNINCSFSVST